MMPRISEYTSGTQALRASLYVSRRVEATVPLLVPHKKIAKQQRTKSTTKIAKVQRPSSSSGNERTFIQGCVKTQSGCASLETARARGAASPRDDVPVTAHARLGVAHGARPASPRIPPPKKEHVFSPLFFFSKAKKSSGGCPLYARPIRDTHPFTLSHFRTYVQYISRLSRPRR